MNRVEAAIQEGRCVLGFGGRAIAESQVLAELRRRSGIPAFVLGGDPVAPAGSLDAAALAVATADQGGVLVLIEPDAGHDGRALNQLGSLIAAAPNKPRLVVVGRSFNPFLLPMAMRLMKLDHAKQRAQDFMAGLPMPPETTAPAVEEAPVAPPVALAASSGRTVAGAPRVAFVGREEEIPALAALLRDGGPLALIGPPGVGRSWLLDKALEHAAEAGEPLERLPDFILRRGSGFDTLAARLADLSGDEALQATLRSDAPVSPSALIASIIEALQADHLRGKVLVFRNLRFLQGRDGYMFNQERIGLLAKALLTHTYALRIVFLNDRAPVFYREGEGHAVTRVDVGGLRGRELYGIFEAWQAEEVPRDKMGEVHNRTAGHPMATRAFAIRWRDSRDMDKLLASKRFLKMGRVDNLEPLERSLNAVLEKLDPSLGEPLVAIGHLSLPATGDHLAALGVRRNERLGLAALGLLESTPTGNPRRYYVHRLVRERLGAFRLSDFERTEQVAQLYMDDAAKAEGQEQLALRQEANRLFIKARRIRSRYEIGYRDNDPVIDTVRGLLQARTQRPGLTLQRINEGLRRDPANTELLTLKIQVLDTEENKRDEIDALIKEVEETCPTPEFFHFLVTRLSGQRNGKPKALVTLDRACAIFPQDAGLRRRRSTILSELGRHADAEQALREAMDLEPMAPEAYSRLGEVLLEQGTDRLDDAEVAIRHAMEQDPDRGMHQARLGRLLRLKATLGDPEQAGALREEAKEHLETALKGNTRAAWPFIELAMLLLEMDGGDMDRAAWCVGKAQKLNNGKRDAALRITQARIQARTGKAAEAEATIQRALKGKESLAYATAALGELYFVQSRIFAAAPQFARAVELSPEGSAERALYERELKRLLTLIESGQAVEIEKAAEASRSAEVRPEAAQVKQQSDRGNTVVRRRGGHAEPRQVEPAGDHAAQLAEDEPEADAPEAIEPEGDDSAPEANEPEGDDGAAEVEPETIEPADEA